MKTKENPSLHKAKGFERLPVIVSRATTHRHM